MDSDYAELMGLFSTPRPNGSAGERRVREETVRWLEARGVPVTRHPFRQYPYFYEATGVWTILSRTLLALAVGLEWGWWALGVALVGLAGGLVDARWHVPLVTWPGARTGQNLIIRLGPEDADREVVLSAHYDTKTELLDHRRRDFLLRHLRTGMALTLLVGLLEPARALLAPAHPLPAFWLHILALVLALPMLALAWGLGLHLSLGRFVTPSQGAVDNGAACVILLKLAERLARAPDAFDRTRVTIALFTGEEVDRQGSRAWVQDRTWPLPVRAVNLELMAQNSDYVLWQRDGGVFHTLPASPELNRLLADAVTEITGKPPRAAPVIHSDAASFLAAGVPAATLGTWDSVWKDAGLHRPTDNLSRIVLPRLPEGVDILQALLHRLDRDAISAG